jgi:hypothetical protein
LAARRKSSLYGQASDSIKMTLRVFLTTAAPIFKSLRKFEADGITAGAGKLSAGKGSMADGV